MVQTATSGTLSMHRSPDAVHVEEVFEPSLMGRIFGGIGAICFMAACLFFWQMPVENDGTTTLIIRIVLCGGMCAIGIVLGRSALIPRDRVTRLEFDRSAQVMTVAEEHAVPFADIERFYAGSQTGHSHQAGGSTVLYMEAKSGPRNGVLIVGSVQELEEFAREANTLLSQPVKASCVDTSPTQVVRGFGRKGIA